ncbi:MAG TPA: hypothetical protein VH092_09860 [Urbifossiella sp.]|jgi:hypothetical protein|nr:hypothetical protein [Urbifossiella sp.]
MPIAFAALGLTVIRRPPLAPPSDRLPDGRLTGLLAALRGAGVVVRDDPEARTGLAELRGLYEPFVAGLAGFFRLAVPGVWPADEGPDNWQTSAWVRRAGPLTSLGVASRGDHFG